jgi:acetylornithine deacetylase/succinyl-diaminopimelate desuccinylase-like protein
MTRRRPPGPLVAALLVLACAHGAPAAGARAGLSEAAAWLRGYLRIDTTNPPGDELRAAAYLARILHREGIPSRVLFSPEGRASLYARLEGAEPGGGLMLLHHLDVVAPGAGWTADPFAGEVREGSLWGRGAVDVKSLGVAHLAALVELKRRGTPLARDVAFLAVADEERGGGQGTGWLLEAHPEVFEGIAAVYGEGGANRALGGRILWWGLERAQKRPLWLRLASDGRGGHGSGLNPHSATHRLLRALARVLDLPPRFRVTQPARDYLEALAPHQPPGPRSVFSNLDAHVFPDRAQGLLPGVANLFLDTIQVTVVETGHQINVVAEEASALLDVRLLPDSDGDELLGRIRAAAGDGVACEVVLTSAPAPPSPVGHPAYAAAAAVLAAEAPVAPAFIPGFTDSRYFRERGLPAYGVSPFALDADALRGIHGPDEHIPLAELDRGVERMRRIVARYAATD